tara:strand:- start:2972 stop:4144 length:1173 start_codon:yes stop_codon:yes gene_type:complete
MKVLLVSSKFYPEYSGSGYRAQKTYERLKNKYDVSYDIISNSLNKYGNKTYKHKGVKIYRISSPLKINYRVKFVKIFTIIFGFFWDIFFTWRFIKSNINEYDLLHTFGNSWSVGFLTWYFSKKNKPIVRELCNKMSNPFYPIQFSRIIEKIFYSNKNLIVAISPMLGKIVKSFGEFNLWTRPNPIGDSFYYEFNKKLFFRKRHTNFNESDIVLSCVANFIPRKNQIFLLDILYKLPNNFKLFLAGPLEFENLDYFKKIKKKLTDLKLTNRVEIKVGFVKNFDEFIKLSDVFLFPSIEEGLGTPILEAQACGVPVVSNFMEDIVEDILINGKGGYYCKLNKAEWFKKILMASKISKIELIKNAKKINSICSHKVIDRNYINKFNKLILKSD